MGHEDISKIEKIFNESSVLTAGEKEFFNENLNKWIEEEPTLSLLISKFSEISLDIRPLLKQKGILA
jgi:hypothetical protein